MGMMKEFKDFAVKGNVVDMAVGIIIGGAFGTIAKVLVSDVIMPGIGILMGGMDFTNLFITLKDGAKEAGPYATLEAAKAAEAVTMNIGVLINSVISFLIVAFVVFMLIKQVNKLKKKEEEKVTTKSCEFCKTEIAIEAKRCPNCTSEVAEVVVKEVEAEAKA